MAVMTSLAAEKKRRRQRAPAAVWADDIVDTLAELLPKSYKAIGLKGRHITTKKARPRKRSIDAKYFHKVMGVRRRKILKRVAALAASMCESEHAPDSNA